MPEFTQGPWRLGKCSNFVVTDSEIPGTENTGHSDKQYYGGNLICESIWRKDDAHLISAAPDLYEALKQILTDISYRHLHRMDGVDMAERALAKADGESK